MARKKMVVVRGGRLVDIAKHTAPFVDILIEGDTIKEVGRPGLAAPADAKVVDARGMLMHPGLINAHTHGHGGLGKGMGDKWTLELLLTAAPWIGGNRTTEDKYLSTFVAAAEMLLKGCTAAYDLTFEFPVPSTDGLGAAAQAYSDAGMRAVLAPMVADMSFFEAIPGLMDALSPALRKDAERYRLAPGKTTLAAMRKAFKSWKQDYDIVRPAVAPTIPHHCSEAFLKGCFNLARDHGLGIHSHVQESKVQVVVGQKLWGMTQTGRLDALGLLGPDFTVAHGVWLDRDDMRRLADHGASVVHNPGSNMRLGSGIADTRSMLDLGVNLGIGTDGANCSDNQNMYESMRLASFASKVRGPDTERWLSTEEVLTAATEGSARALGFGDRIGRIAPGYKADIVFLDLATVNWLPLNDATNQLVHTEDGNSVHSVMVGGRMVVEDRKLVGLDMAALAAKVEAARARLAKANADNKKLFDRLERVVNRFCPGLAKMPYHIDHYAGGHHDHQH